MGSAVKEQRTKFRCSLRFSRTKRAEAKHGALLFYDYLRETKRSQTINRSGWSNRDKRATDVGKAMQPTIADLDREKGSARAQHAINFGEGFFLLTLGEQMMQNEHGNNGRKGLVGKWQRRRIPAQYADIRSAESFAQARGKLSVVLKTGHARYAAPQLLRRRTGPGTEFQNVVPKLVARNHPRKNFLLRNPSP